MAAPLQVLPLKATVSGSVKRATYSTTIIGIFIQCPKNIRHISMAQTNERTSASELGDDDWEQLNQSQPDDVSIISDDDIPNDGNNQDFVEVDHPKKTSYPGRHYSNPKDEPSGPLPTLRRSLYDLKDILEDSIKHLEDFNQEASMQALSLSGPIMQAQQRQVDALNVLLTNYAADWEISASQGGMTFDEFADIDPVSVNELYRIFKNFAAEVRERTRDAEVKDDADTDDENEDIGWLDFILPAIDEVSMLLRVPQEAGHDSETLQPAKESSSIGVPRGGASPMNESASVRSQTNVHDEKVHEKMMMVSDW